MTINVKDLKKLSLELCFVKTRVSSPLREYIVKYLKEKKGTAYTIVDLVPIYRTFRNETVKLYKQQISEIDVSDKAEKRRLERKFLITDSGTKIKTKIYSSLNKELQLKDGRIKKKGSYYWYEKK